MWSDLATIIIGPTRALNITYFCIGKPCCRILIYSSMTITIQVIHDHPEHKHMFIICIMFCKMNSLISNFISLAMTDVLQYLPTALFVYYCDVPSFPGSFPESNNFLNSILNSIHSSSAISLSTLERKPSGTCDLQILRVFFSWARIISNAKQAWRSLQEALFIGKSSIKLLQRWQH